MTNVIPHITAYHDEIHRSHVIALWREVFGYETAHNAPDLAIDRKIAVADGLFFVALDAGKSESSLVGTIMAGYDGHRGWLYSLAVHPEYRLRGIGSLLLKTAEEALITRGCLKINLQILSQNGCVQEFYEAHGYTVEERISMGKRFHT